MTLKENAQRISTAKQNIKTSVANKGVNIPDDAKIDMYPSFIDQITTGGKTYSIRSHGVNVNQDFYGVNIGSINVPIFYVNGLFGVDAIPNNDSRSLDHGDILVVDTTYPEPPSFAKEFFRRYYTLINSGRTRDIYTLSRVASLVWLAMYDEDRYSACRFQVQYQMGEPFLTFFDEWYNNKDRQLASTKEVLVYRLINTTHTNYNGIYIGIPTFKDGEILPGVIDFIGNKVQVSEV